MPRAAPAAATWPRRWPSFASVNLQASWELDLFGANQAGRDAALARLQGAQAGWHDARIAVAAEVAASYNSLRSCEAVVVQTEADTLSRAETARVTELAAKAGLFAPASAALARASAAQGRSLLAGQKAQCELLLKSLVALTALDETELRRQLAPRLAQLPVPAGIAVQSVPAAALMQRPDLLVAERQIVAAAEDTAQNQALRYPRVAITGAVGPAWLRVAGRFDQRQRCGPSARCRCRCRSSTAARAWPTWSRRGRATTRRCPPTAAWCARRCARSKAR